MVSDFRKAQGQLHEDAALKKIGEDAFNLNDNAAKGMRGHNYPTFDICSLRELTSVKSHISSLGEVSAQDIESYKSDFSEMLGVTGSYDRGLSPLEQKAENIKYLSDSGQFPVPEEIKGAGINQVQDYLKNNTVMRIPDDHVQVVRNTLAADARNLPENYYLPSDPSDEQVNSILNRVQGTGMTSAETIEKLQSKGYVAQKASGTPLQEPIPTTRQTEEPTSNIGKTSQEEAQSAAETIGEVVGKSAAGPLSDSVGKAAGQAAREAANQAADVTEESVGESIQPPETPATQSAANIGSTETPSQSEDYNYGYGM
jgi:hypothetical protein